MTTFKIPESNLEALRKTIARLAKTATRLGCTGVSFRETGETEMVEIQTEAFPIYRKLIEVEITGEAPKLPGWSFLAAVQPAEGTDFNILQVFGDVPEGTLDAYRSCDLRCDHCNVNRRRVKAYIVLRESDGHVAMVGSDCLAHYTGHENPEDVARAAEMLALILATASEGEGDEWGGGGGRVSYLSLEDFLSATAAQIRARGWVSRSKARDEFLVVVLHEVAHSLVPADQHGPVFARLFFELLTHYEKVPAAKIRALAVHQKPRRVRFAEAASSPKPVSAEWKRWHARRMELDAELRAHIASEPRREK